MVKTGENKVNVPTANIYANNNKKKLNTAKKKPPPKSQEPEASTSNNEDTGMGMKEVFKLIADENGRVTSARLRGFVKDLDLEFSDEEIKEMMQVVDPTGKGEVTYKGLVGIVRDFNTEFPNIQLTPAEMKRELTVLTEEATFVTETETESTVTQQTDDTGAEEPKQVTDKDNTVDVETEEKPSTSENEADNADIADDNQVDHEDENNDKDVEESGENVDNCENEADEDDNEDDDVIKADQASDNDADGDDVNDDRSETRSDGRLSKQPTRMSFNKEYRLDSAITTVVSKMADDNKSLQSTTSKKTRARSKSESSTSSRKSSVSKKVPSRCSSRERNNSKANQPVNNKTTPPRKSVFKPLREPEFYSTIGCSLKLSQIRLKQRLLYIMWRVVYDQAVKRMQEEKQREMAARRQGKKPLKKRLSIPSNS